MGHTTVYLFVFPVKQQHGKELQGFALYIKCSALVAQPLKNFSLNTQSV